MVGRLSELSKLFALEFLPISIITGNGLGQLQNMINKRLIELALGKGSRGEVAEQASAVALTARHRQAVTDAIGNISESIIELSMGNDEITAMLLRTAHQSICDIEQHNFDEKILERIFSRFCIGK